MAKIFVLGTKQLNFIYLLCRGIRSADPSLVFGCMNLTSFSGQRPLDFNDVFAGQHTERSGFFFFILSAIKSLGQGMFWRTLIYIVLVEFKWLKAIGFWISWNREQAFFLRTNLSEYSVFHFHFIQYSYIKAVWFVPQGRKIVCTFWGSDLLRTSDSLNHFMVQRALLKADIITTQSKELREIILAKFGRTLKPKIRILKLTADQEIFEAIDKASLEDVSLVKAKLGIPAGKSVIVVGHNASPFNNHGKILESLKRMKSAGDIVAVIPFSYGTGAAEALQYRQQLELVIKGCPFQVIFLDTYASSDDVARLRVVTDVMVHLPESDALSGAATECMYAGGVLLTGSWLPYSPFREVGLVFYETESFESVEHALEATLSDLPNLKAKCRQNKPIITQNFFPEATTKGWVRMFHEMGKG